MRISIANARRAASRPGDELAPPRCVLMLVSGFPPAREYVLRTVKFAKYLPDYGWTPIVVTPLVRTGIRAAPLVATPSGVVVKRIPRVPTLANLALAWMRKRKDLVRDVSSAGPVIKTR